MAFGGSRTYHRIACAIEDAGFEIRDCIMWIYGSGFPKSLNLGKKLPEWEGWGTQLKPAYEPIVIARKPFKGSLTDNVANNGVGGYNIKECKIGTEVRTQFSGRSTSKSTVYFEYKQDNAHYETVEGRFPTNLILTYDEIDKDEVCGGMPNSKGKGAFPKKINGKSNITFRSNEERPERIELNDSGSVSRYFYCAKASKKDRDEGLDEFEEKIKVFNGQSDKSSKDIKDVEQRFTTKLKNIHPTVKPTSLMQYLVKLVTPKDAIILDPFMGSGSTGKAVMYENRERDVNYKFIGIELNEEYLPIAEARIKFAKNN